MMHFCHDDFFIFSNSVDIDEMPHYAAFHLSLHRLQKYLFAARTQYNWVYWVRVSFIIINFIINFEFRTINPLPKEIAVIILR